MHHKILRRLFARGTPVASGKKRIKVTDDEASRRSPRVRFNVRCERRLASKRSIVLDFNIEIFIRIILMSIASSELYTCLDINIDSLIIFHRVYATTIAFVVLAMSETSWKSIQVEFKEATKSLIIYCARSTRGKGGSG